MLGDILYALLGAGSIVTITFIGSYFQRKLREENNNMTMNMEELREELEKFLPDTFEIDITDDGEVVINTGLKVTDDDELIPIDFEDDDDDEELEEIEDESIDSDF